MSTENNTPPLVEGLTETEIQAIHKFYGAWKAKKPEWLEEVCTLDWQDIPLPPKQAKGPQGLKDLIVDFIEKFPDAEIVVEEIFGTHERAGASVLTIADFQQNIFTTYKERTTGTGFHLSSIDDAFECNNYHEGMHLGYLLSIRKFV